MKILKRLNLIKSATIKDSGENSDSVRIYFDNIGGGLEAYVSAFDNTVTGIHKIQFYGFGTGAVDFIRKITKEELEKFEEGKSSNLPESEAKKYPYYQVRMEAKDFFNKEIFKAAQEFDKKIEEIAKKYGYTRKK